MYIECKTFGEWLKKANKDSISPGGMAKEFRVTRQTVNNWINNNVIDAYSYDGKEGGFVIIQTSEYKKVGEYMDKYSKS